jgi:hypothetical protein
MIISPIGSIIAGPITELIGIQLLFLACAIATIVLMLGMYFFTNIRHVRYNGNISLGSELNEKELFEVEVIE